jgi:hypothetical protein
MSLVCSLVRNALINLSGTATDGRSPMTWSSNRAAISIKNVSISLVLTSGRRNMFKQVYYTVQSHKINFTFSFCEYVEDYMGQCWSPNFIIVQLSSNYGTWTNRYAERDRQLYRLQNSYRHEATAICKSEFINILSGQTEQNLFSDMSKQLCLWVTSQL